MVREAGPAVQESPCLSLARELKQGQTVLVQRCLLALALPTTCKARTGAHFVALVVGSAEAALRAYSSSCPSWCSCLVVL